MTALPDLPRGADPARASSSRVARRRLPVGPAELLAAALLLLVVVMAVAPGLLAPADPLAVSPTTRSPVRRPRTRSAPTSRGGACGPASSTGPAPR
jgi:hypothetical protein